jgi:DNA-binding response OmpR family regulator
VEDAIRVALEQRPDAMLLDLSLPDGDGLLVLEHLIAKHAQPRVTIALTGHDDSPTRARCLRAGCREVLVKPMSPLSLPGRMSAWLSESAESRSGS